MDLQNEVQGLTIKESENNIELAITQAFVQVLYADEAVKINEGTVEVSKAQRDRGKALLEHYRKPISLSWKLSMPPINISWL